MSSGEKSEVALSNVEFDCVVAALRQALLVAVVVYGVRSAVASTRLAWIAQQTVVFVAIAGYRHLSFHRYLTHGHRS